MQQFRYSEREQRCLLFAVDRVADLEAFEESQKPDATSKNALEKVVSGQKASTRAVDSTFEKTVDRLTKAGYITRGKKLDEIDVSKVKKYVKAEAEKQAEARVSTAKISLTKAQDQARYKVNKNASSTERKLGLANARVEVYRDMIADTEALIKHHEADAEGMNELAEILETDGINSIALQKKTMLKGVAEDLLAEAMDAYDKLKDAEFGPESYDKATKILQNVEKEILKRDPKALVHLEDALFSAAAFGPTEAAKRIDGMAMNGTEKKLLKEAVAKLSASDLRQASQYHLNGILKGRVEKSAVANGKPTTKERVDALTGVTRGQKVQVNIMGVRRAFVVAAPSAGNHYTYLIDANGKYASIDRQGDSGKLFLTYYKGAKDAKAISVPFNDAPKVPKTYDPTIIYLAAGNPLVP